MNTAEKKASAFKYEFAEEISRIEKPATESKLVLFLSFDICNWTALKQATPHWINIINKFVATKFPNMTLWKFSGDEVIFKREVNSILFISDVIVRAHRQIISLNQEFKKLAPEGVDIYVMATVWLAEIADENSSAQNFELFDLLESGSEQDDYVGINVDEGFRLTQCAEWNKVTIDPKIVYALLLSAEICFDDDEALEKVRQYKRFPYNIPSEFIDSIEQCRLNPLERKRFHKCISKISWMGYVRCKGVWDNRLYPVFWYYTDDYSDYSEYHEDSQKVRCFFYDDMFQGELLCKVTRDKSKITDRKETLELLQDIFEQVKKYDEVLGVFNLLHFDRYHIPTISNKRAKLYYTVVCVSPNREKVLIAKRKSTDVWDFGNVRHQNTGMATQIETECKDEFGIDIKVITDPDRGNSIVPLGFGTVHRGTSAQSELLCCAQISSEGSDDDLLGIIRSKLPHTDYSDIAFVTLSEAKAYEDTLKETGTAATIPWFSDSVKRAIEACEC